MDALERYCIRVLEDDEGFMFLAETSTYIWLKSIPRGQEDRWNPRIRDVKVWPIRTAFTRPFA